MKVIPTTIAHQPADPRIKTGDENSTPNRGGNPTTYAKFEAEFGAVHRMSSAKRENE